MRRIPKLRRHIRGLGTVRIDGRDVYFGHWPKGQKKPPEDVQAEYDRLIGEWLARGRLVQPTEEPASGPTVAEVCLAFMEHAKIHYRTPEGKPGKEYILFRYVLRPLVHLFGNMRADHFSPLKLDSVRQLMVHGYEHPRYGQQEALCRKVVNHRMNRIRHVFKWAVSREMVPVTVHQALKTLAPLQAGRTEARETEPVKPVADSVVDALLPHLPRHVAGLVRFQRLTGCRPGEACRITLSQIDRTGEVWIYRPTRHKTQHRGKQRFIPIGPQAQAVLAEFVTPEHENRPDEPIFSPARQREEIHAAKRAARKTRVQPSQKNRKKANAKRLPGQFYTAESYGKAIRQVAERLGMEFWAPNRLRHTAATVIRKQFGLQAASDVLGHSGTQVTEIYAERSLDQAIKVAREIG